MRKSKRRYLRRDSNPQFSAHEADALSIRPRRLTISLQIDIIQNTLNTNEGVFIQ